MEQPLVDEVNYCYNPFLNQLMPIEFLNSLGKLLYLYLQLIQVVYECMGPNAQSWTWLMACSPYVNYNVNHIQPKPVR